MFVAACILDKYVEIKLLLFLFLNKRLASFTGERPQSPPQWYARKPTDDVYLKALYPAPLLTVTEAVECHCEVCGPDMYDIMDSYLYLTLQLDMRMEKKVRSIIVKNCYIFTCQERNFPAS